MKDKGQDKLEKILGELEKVVGELEGGQVPLEEGLIKFEQGVKLYKKCKIILGQVEQKITVLSRELSSFEVSTEEPE